MAKRTLSQQMDKRWMMFVDGENLTIRAQELAKQKNFEFLDGPFYSKDSFIWPAPADGDRTFLWLMEYCQPVSMRSYYYTTVQGSLERMDDVTQRIWNLKFHPEVFHKDKNRPNTKGVDITLTKDMLWHAFFDNYDWAVLVAGDGDYVPLVRDVKRMGKFVCVAFFERCGLSPKLRLEADRFIEFESLLFTLWTSFKDEEAKRNKT
jgi:uncharacterized LabA/DUF88 family protein